MRRWGVLAIAAGGLGLLASLLFRVVSPASVESGASVVSPEVGRAVRPLTGLGRASAALMPKPVAGVFLDMNEAQLSAVRPRAKRHEPADDEHHYVFDEPWLGSRMNPPASTGRSGQILYLFSKERHLLARVQLAQQLADVTALSARIQEQQNEYGPASGVWDCQAPGQLPTRRFSWLRGPVGVMDVVLLLKERVLATLYVGSRDDLQTSLVNAACVPTPPERFSKFPAVPL